MKIAWLRLSMLLLSACVVEAPPGTGGPGDKAGSKEDGPPQALTGWVQTLAADKVNRDTGGTRRGEDLVFAGTAGGPATAPDALVTRIRGDGTLVWQTRRDTSGTEFGGDLLAQGDGV